MTRRTCKWRSSNSHRKRKLELSLPTSASMAFRQEGWCEEWVARTQEVNMDMVTRYRRDLSMMRQCFNQLSLPSPAASVPCVVPTELDRIYLWEGRTLWLLLETKCNQTHPMATSTHNNPREDSGVEYLEASLGIYTNLQTSKTTSSRHYRYIPKWAAQQQHLWPAVPLQPTGPASTT